MARKSRRNSNDSAMEKFNGNFLKLTQILDGKDDKLLQQLQKLHNDCKDIINYAQEYDFDDKTPFNGFRTFVKMIAIYFSKLVAVSEGTPSRKRIRRQQEFASLVDTFVHHLSIMKLARQKKMGVEDSDWGEEDSLDQQIGEKMLDVDCEQIKLFYRDSTNGFWLCPSLRKFMINLYFPTMLFVLYPFRTSIRNIFDREVGKKIYADFAANCSLSDIKTLWNAGDARMSRFMGTSKNMARGKNKSIKFPRQREWTLNEDGKLIRKVPDEVDAVQVIVDNTDARNNNNEGNNKSNNIPDYFDQRDPKTYVKLMYIHYGRKGVSPNDSIIFHAHGGGFVALTPKGHEVYLRRWAKKLKVPVLSVYYRLAPEYPYPAALQDILDAYLHLTSGSLLVKQKLGFHPKNIVLAGDSAGGNLALALTFLLNDMKKQQESVVMPRSLCLQYPCGNPFIGTTSASRSLIVFDNLLPVGVVHAAVIGYPGDKTDYVNKSSVITGIKPWYRLDKESTTKIVSKYRYKLKDPYFNVLCSNSFDELKDIKLFVQASEFDPILDDAIQISRKWKGYVKLDVIPNVNHGFLNFQDFSKEAKVGAKTTTMRIKQGLGISKLDEEEQ